MGSLMPPMTPMALPFPLSIIETQQAEQAARLLFKNVTWVRELNNNTGLCMDDQLTILEASWCELFLLSTAQNAPQIDPSHLFLPGSDSYNHAIADIARFREVVATFRSLKLDDEEYSCVKAMVLYKAGLDCESMSSSRSSSGSISPGGCRLKDTALVLKLRDNAQTQLSIKMQAITPSGAVRYNQLTLVLVPLLRKIPGHSIENFFFRRTIGFTPIEKIISDVYVKPSS